MARTFLNKQFSNYLGENRAILDIYASGSPDPSPTAPQPTPTSTPYPGFCVGSGFDTFARGVTYSGGSYFVYGSFEFYQGNTAPLLTKLNSNGTWDANFISSIPYSLGNTSNGVFAFAGLSGGSFYAAGFYQVGSPYLGINRFFPDGTVDPSFNNATYFGLITDIVLASDETYLFIGGNFTSPTNRILKLLPTGAVDTTFTAGTGFNFQVTCLEQDSSGNIFAGGTFTQYKGVSRNRLMKIDEFGTADATFVAGLGTGFNSGSVYDMVLVGGFLYVVGTFTSYNGTSTNRIAKINATTGVLDATFTTNIGTGLNTTGLSDLTILYNPVNDRLVITYYTTNVFSDNFNGTTIYGRIFALTTTGLLDTNFGSQSDALYGFNDRYVADSSSAESGTVLPNGDMVFVGDFNAFSNQYMPGLVKINMSGVSLSTSDCFRPRISPTMYPTPTPTPSPIPLALSFNTTYGDSVPAACAGSPVTVYAADLGNCGPCLPFNCWACLDTNQQVYLDVFGTTLVPDGYYTNDMDGLGNYGTWHIVGGYPQGGGFTGGC